MQTVPPSCVPHTLGPPSPHVAGEVHVPHWIRPPHPSPCGPQPPPSDAHVFGTQVPITLPSPPASPKMFPLSSSGGGMKMSPPPPSSLKTAGSPLDPHAAMS